MNVLSNVHTLELDIWPYFDKLKAVEISQLGRTLSSLAQLNALRLDYSCVHDSICKDDSVPVADAMWRFPRLQHLKLSSEISRSLSIWPALDVPELRTLSILSTCDSTRALQLCQKAPRLVSIRVLVNNYPTLRGDPYFAWTVTAMQDILQAWTDAANPHRWPDLKAMTFAHSGFDVPRLKTRIARMRQRTMTDRRLVAFDPLLDPLTRLGTHPWLDSFHSSTHL